MLQHRARSWRSLRFASQFSQSLTGQGRSFTNTTASSTPDSGTLLSRLSDRTHPRIRHTERKSPHPRVQLKEPRSPATSFISPRSVQQRDHAAEKWFRDVRKIDIDKVNQSDNTGALPHKKNTDHQLPKQHQLRPKTDLNALFAPSTLSSATSMRLQTKKELGGDYTGYLPDGFADPYRLPIDYARLALGRNKHIPLTAQNGALNIIKEAIQGRTTRQGKYD